MSENKENLNTSNSFQRKPTNPLTDTSLNKGLKTGHNATNPLNTIQKQNDLLSNIYQESLTPYFKEELINQIHISTKYEKHIAYQELQTKVQDLAKEQIELKLSKQELEFEREKLGIMQQIAEWRQKTMQRGGAMEQLNKQMAAIQE